MRLRNPGDSAKWPRLFEELDLNTVIVLCVVHFLQPNLSEVVRAQADVRTRCPCGQETLPRITTCGNWGFGLSDGHDLVQTEGTVEIGRLQSVMARSSIDSLVSLHGMDAGVAMLEPVGGIGVKPLSDNNAEAYDSPWRYWAIASGRAAARPSRAGPAERSGAPPSRPG